MLYISYITVFTLGFEEGMYIKYGGKEFNEINLETFKYEHRLYILLQIVFSTIVFLFGVFSENLILILMAITIVPYNIVVFFKANYKALGEFKIYTKIVYLQTILDLILNILLVFFIKSSSYIMFCLAIIVINLAGAFYVEGNFYKKLKGIKCVYNKKIKNNFKVGFVILIANLSIMIFYGLDRWFIKIFFTEYDFAYYSFAISMLNLI
ncbi:capsular biosynthesis protein, partial [Clostridium perfringens]|nr:capsular biosynthesis protein [Clostridium perfringens]